MDNGSLQRLENYLWEYFPHLARLWGRKVWDEFIMTRELTTLAIFRTANDTITSETEQLINGILFGRPVASPFRQVKTAIEHDFPRFHQKLETLVPEVRRLILIDVTIHCSPSGFLMDNLGPGNLPKHKDNNLTLKIANYLNRYLKILKP